MAFDGIVTKSIVSELQNIIGSKIDKIHEPDRNTIILGVYFQGKNYALNICIDAHNCRMNLTTHTKINPLVAPNFCMLLRKHLIGGRILDISMQGLERIVNIKIETINEFNEIEIRTLIIELMGKHSNIILTKSNGLIIDAMRHISSTNSYREILPSRIYALPKSDKYDFTKVKDFSEFKEKVKSSDAIANTFTGFSNIFVKSAVKDRDLQQTYQYICKIIEGKENLEIQPISQYNTCFACCKSYYEKIKDKVRSLNDLSNYTLVISGSSRRRQMLDEILQKDNIKLNPKHLMPDSKLMADYIKANDYIGYFIEDELKEYDLVKMELKEEMPKNPIGIIYSKKTINHIARDFVTTVLED